MGFQDENSKLQSNVSEFIVQGTRKNEDPPCLSLSGDKYLSLAGVGCQALFVVFEAMLLWGMPPRGLSWNCSGIVLASISTKLM